MSTIRNFIPNHDDKSITVSDAPSSDAALAQLNAAVGEVEKKKASQPGLWCFIPIIVGSKELDCGRPRGKSTDLCCGEHWKQVPKELKQRLIDANKTARKSRFSGSEKALNRAGVTVTAIADEVVAYLTSLPIQLPPVERLVVEEKKILGPDGLQRPDKLVSSNSKLIIPGG